MPITKVNENIKCSRLLYSIISKCINGNISIKVKINIVTKNKITPSTRYQTSITLTFDHTCSTD